MKEFTSQTGGRYTYVDDILNLQELALAFSSIFEGCENFIISGCHVTAGKISPGYVYINGKIRYCSGTSNAVTWPMYVYESNKTEKVSYADAGDKVGRNVFGCSVASSVPVSNDSITNKPPQSITIQQNGTAVRLGEALFGKYAVLFSPVNASQTIEKPVYFNGHITAKKGLEALGDVQLTKGSNAGYASLDDSGNMVIRLSAVNNSHNYAVKVLQEGKFQFFKDSACLATISSDGSEFTTSMSSKVVKNGFVMMAGNHLYNYNLAADSGTLSINMCGYNGGNTYFRNTEIGDGKGTALISVNGKLHTVSMTKTTITSSEEALLVLKNTAHAFGDKALKSYVAWHDQNGKTIARVGFDSADNNNLNIYNAEGDVTVGNTVRITGQLYVGGNLISSTYVSNQNYTDGMAKKADADKVYTKEYIDKNMPMLSKGFSDYVVQMGSGETGQAALRKQLAAASSAELQTCNTTLAAKANSKDVYTKTEADGLFAKLTDGFKKFVEKNGGSTTGQAALRNQIGACSASDFKQFSETTNQTLQTKADASKVYTKIQVDTSFAVLSKGFTQYMSVVGDTTAQSKQILRSQIDVPSVDNLKEYVNKGQLFNDIVDDGLDTGSPSYVENKKTRQRTLCQNLGAAFKEDVQMKPKDTGWLKLSLAGGYSDIGLHVRQIGNIVCIQGDITPPHSGTVFTLPGDIDPPAYKVGMCHIHRKGWQCAIDGHSRTCYVTKCDGGCHNNIGFLITYMV